MVSGASERGAFFPFTFAGGCVKRAVLRPSFACREEKSVLSLRGCTEVPQSSHTCCLCLPLVTSIEKSQARASQKQDFNLGKLTLRFLLQDPLSLTGGGPTPGCVGSPCFWSERKIFYPRSRAGDALPSVSSLPGQLCLLGCCPEVSYKPCILSNA